MIRLFLAAVCGLALAALACDQAAAQYYRRSCYTPSYYTAPCYSPPCYQQPCYQAPCYSPQCYPSYGAWQWSQWDTDPTYWVANRWVYYSACDKRWESSPYLYIKTHCGYERALLKCDYHVQFRSLELRPEPRLSYHGSAVYGFDPFRYSVAREYGPDVGRFVSRQYQDPPSPLDVAAFFPPPATERGARLEHVGKASVAAVDGLKEVALQDAQNEREETAIRGNVTARALKHQAIERTIGKVLEAYDDPGIDVGGGATPRAIVDVGDPNLGALISAKCIKCHGGSEGVAGGIDFREARSFDDEKWAACWAEVKAGTMPKEGGKLKPADVALFKKQMLSALAKGR